MINNIENAAPVWKSVMVTRHLPEELSGLETLCKNLWWCWNDNAKDLFRAVDYELWHKSGHNPMVILDQVSLKRYKELVALDHLSISVNKGEVFGLLGPNGSGKSTLLNCIAAVIKPTSGSIEMNGKEISKLSGSHLAEYRGKDMGYIFQSFELIDNLTGKENILLPVSLHGGKEDADSERFRKITEYLEIKDILYKFPSQMSGGEKQRIAAARALILNPGMILCDEPTGALDSKNAKALMTKLSGLNSEDGSTILMVTHDSNAASFCNRIMFIQDGKLFHELRKEDNESRESFYDRILKVLAQLGGGSANVL